MHLARNDGVIILLGTGMSPFVMGMSFQTGAVPCILRELGSPLESVAHVDLAVE